LSTHPVAGDLILIIVCRAAQRANIIRRMLGYTSNNSGEEPMKRNRMNKLRAAMLIAAGLCAANMAQAQNFPNRAVRMLIPFTVGSAADVIARAMEPDAT